MNMAFELDTTSSAENTPQSDWLSRAVSDAYRMPAAKELSDAASSVGDFAKEHWKEHTGVGLTVIAGTAFVVGRKYGLGGLAGLLKGVAQPHNPGEIIREFTEELYQGYRSDRNDNPSVLNALKEYWAYLSLSFDEPLKVFRKIRKSGNFEDYEEAIHLIFNEYRWLGS